jgi:hypothetical protein
MDMAYLQVAAVLLTLAELGIGWIVGFGIGVGLLVAAAVISFYSVEVGKPS